VSITGKTITVGRAEYDRIKTFGNVVIRCKQTGEYTLYGNRFGEVVIEDGLAPYCPECGSGEWMKNEDEGLNNYCGQCGTKLDWGRLSPNEDRVSSNPEQTRE